MKQSRAYEGKIEGSEEGIAGCTGFLYKSLRTRPHNQHLVSPQGLVLQKRVSCQMGEYNR